MEITLIRHGKSSWTSKAAISCAEFNQWAENYDAAGIIQETAVPEQTKEKAQEAKLIVTSTLKRSIQSAEWLHPNAPILSDALFREAELPVFVSSFFSIKAPPSFWAVGYRCAWLIGYKGEKESVKETKQRAAEASSRLIQLAAEHEKVLLAGHGIFNRFIARELIKAGWKGPKKTGRQHWSCTCYVLNERSDSHARVSKLS